MGISREEWLEALNGLYDDDEGDTVKEIAEKTGRDSRTVRRMLDKAVEEGTIIKGVAHRNDSMGRYSRVFVYKMVEPSKKIAARSKTKVAKKSTRRK